MKDGEKKMEENKPYRKALNGFAGVHRQVELALLNVA
jgi:hypothetical protein